MITKKLLILIFCILSSNTAWSMDRYLEEQKEIRDALSKVKIEFARLTPATPTTSLDENDVMTPFGQKMRAKHQVEKNAVFHSYALGFHGEIIDATGPWQERRRRIMEGIYAGVKPDTCPTGFHSTALWHATLENDIPLIQKLLEYKANPSKKINKDILLCAKTTEVAQLLVNNGASLQPKVGLLHNVIMRRFEPTLIAYYASKGITKDSLYIHRHTPMKPINLLLEEKLDGFAPMTIDMFINYLEELRKIGVTQDDAEKACTSFEARNKSTLNQYKEKMDNLKTVIAMAWVD